MKKKELYIHLVIIFIVIVLFFIFKDFFMHSNVEEKKNNLTNTGNIDNLLTNSGVIDVNSGSLDTSKKEVVYKDYEMKYNGSVKKGDILNFDIDIENIHSSGSIIILKFSNNSDFSEYSIGTGSIELCDESNDEGSNNEGSNDEVNNKVIDDIEKETVKLDTKDILYNKFKKDTTVSLNRNECIENNEIKFGYMLGKNRNRKKTFIVGGDDLSTKEYSFGVNEVQYDGELHFRIAILDGSELYVKATLMGLKKINN